MHDVDIRSLRGPGGYVLDTTSGHPKPSKLESPRRGGGSRLDGKSISLGLPLSRLVSLSLRFKSKPDRLRSCNRLIAASVVLLGPFGPDLP